MTDGEPGREGSWGREFDLLTACPMGQSGPVVREAIGPQRPTFRGSQLAMIVEASSTGRQLEES